MANLDFLKQLTNKLNEPVLDSHILHALLEQCSDAYWIWEIETNYDYLSPGWQRLLGYSEDELPHRYETWRNLLTPEDYDKAYKAVRAHIESLGVIPYECTFGMRRKDGTFQHVIATGAVIKWKGTRPLIMAGKLTALPPKEVKANEPR